MIAPDPRKRFKLYSVHTGESMSRALNRWVAEALDREYA